MSRKSEPKHVSRNFLLAAQCVIGVAERPEIWSQIPNELRLAINALNMTACHEYLQQVRSVIRDLTSTCNLRGDSAVLMRATARKAKAVTNEEAEEVPPLFAFLQGKERVKRRKAK